MIITEYDKELLRLQNLKASIVDAEFTLKNLTVEVKGVKNEYDRLVFMAEEKSRNLDNDILLKHRTTIGTIANTEEELRNILVGVEEQIKKKNLELETLVHNIQTSGDSLNSFTIQIIKLERQVRDLGVEADKLKATNDILKSSIECKQKDIALLEITISNLKEQKNVLTVENSNLEGKNDSLLIENEDLGNQAELLGKRERIYHKQRNVLLAAASKMGIKNQLP